MFELEQSSRLAFPVRFKERTLETVGDAITLFSKLSSEQVDCHYWRRAIIMMHTAINYRQFLKTATINLETATLMDRPTSAQQPRN